MNDFTKTQLREIHRCLNLVIKGGTTPYSCLTMSLSNKVKEMYESYCEHESKYEDSALVDRCKDCDQIILYRCDDCDHENLKDVGKEYQVCRGCGKEIYP